MGLAYLMEDVDVPSFIEVVKKRPELWDVNCDMYRRMGNGPAVWEQVATDVFANFLDMEVTDQTKLVKAVMYKWKSLREGYSRAHRRNEEMAAAGLTPGRAYVYARQLAFLEPMLPVTLQRARRRPRPPGTTARRAPRTAEAAAARTKRSLLAHIESRVPQLIRLVKQYPALWDPANPQYKQHNTLTKHWTDVTQALFPDFSSQEGKMRVKMMRLVADKWRRMRNTYTRNVRCGGGGGGGGGAARKSLLSFLQPTVVAARGGGGSLLAPSTSAASQQSDPSDDDDACAEPDTELEEEYEKEMKFCEVMNMSDPLVTAADEGATSSTAAAESHLPLTLTPTTTTTTASALRPTDSHLAAFFASILPSVNAFDDDQTLDFQIGVLKIIKDIKNNSTSC